MHHRDGSRPVIALPVPALVERLTRLAAGTGTCLLYTSGVSYWSKGDLTFSLRENVQAAKGIAGFDFFAIML